MTAIFSPMPNLKISLLPPLKTKLEEVKWMENEGVLESRLGLDLLWVTEAAALESVKWLGKGEKAAGDKAAVDAMRRAFSHVAVEGTVIIGEGEKDNAPMLYNGEKVGKGGPRADIAVDPVEGTNLLAGGRPNAISVVGMAPGGSMYDPGPSYYMKKIVVPEGAGGGLDLDAPVEENLLKIGRSLGKEVCDLTVFVLNKPRHRELIREIREAGAAVQLHDDGDVAGALMAVDPEFPVDVMMGTGGTPEGVLTACAVKGIGGTMLSRLDPLTEEEKRALLDHGTDLTRILTEDSLVAGDNLFFAATGISGGTFLSGVGRRNGRVFTHSLLIDGKNRSMRYIKTSRNQGA